ECDQGGVLVLLAGAVQDEEVGGVADARLRKAGDAEADPGAARGAPGRLERKRSEVRRRGAGEERGGSRPRAIGGPPVARHPFDPDLLQMRVVQEEDDVRPPRQRPFQCPPEARTVGQDARGQLQPPRKAPRGLRGTNEVIEQEVGPLDGAITGGLECCDPRLSHCFPPHAVTIARKERTGNRVGGRPRRGNASGASPGDALASTFGACVLRSSSRSGSFCSVAATPFRWTGMGARFFASATCPTSPTRPPCTGLRPASSRRPWGRACGWRRRPSPPAPPWSRRSSPGSSTSPSSAPIPR